VPVDSDIAKHCNPNNLGHFVGITAMIIGLKKKKGGEMKKNPGPSWREEKRKGKERRRKKKEG